MQVRNVATYHIVLDPVDLGVRLGRLLVEAVLNPVDLQHADLLERPAGDRLGELAVAGRAVGLVAGPAHLCVEPLVLQHLGRADEGEAGRVACLHRRHQAQLLAGGEDLVQRLALLLGVVAVGRGRGAHDGRQQRARAQRRAHAAREGQQGARGGGGAAEEVLDIWPDGARGRQDEHVVEVRGAGGVVVEVVDHEAGAVGGELDVELGEEGDQAGWGWVA